MKNIISILDLGINNVQSVGKAVEKVGYGYNLVSSANEIEHVEKLIIPGVGSFDEAMQRLTDLEVIESLNKKARIEKIPILGICLGFQMMTNGSEEGKLDGLGWFDCHTRRIHSLAGQKVKIPHMGWNDVAWRKKSKFIEGIKLPSRFYFVHSFVPRTDQSNELLASCNYGLDMHVALERDNFIGVQFHPEKSHVFGLKLIENFCTNY